jgi:hypothetical protein
MRKHLIWVLGLAVAVGSVVLASLAFAAPNTQTIDGKVSPKKLPKHDRVAISLTTNVEATNTGNANQIPNPTTFARVDFDKDILIQQKGYPTCDPSQFGASSTIQDVKRECGDSVVGTGSATIKVPTATGSPPLTVNAETIGAVVKGKKLLLHSYNSLSGGQPLVGTFAKTPGSAGGGYALTLNVPVPPLAGGTAVITQFGLTTKKISYNHGGKKLAIVSARCSDKSLKFQARFTDDKGQLAVGKDTFACQQKAG